jgi:hypothetical protein
LGREAGETGSVEIASGKRAMVGSELEFGEAVVVEEAGETEFAWEGGGSSAI